MALGRKKKDESTNDKIIRLFQEGKSVEDIVGEVALRADIVTGVIQRKLGADAVPDAAVPHEKSQAAAIVNSASAAPPAPAAAPAEPASEEVEGMSKLERYMFEKKKKMESEPAPAPAPSAPSTGEMEGISLTGGLSAPETSPEPIPLVNEAPKEPEVHRVSLVDDYMRKEAERDSNIPRSTSNMDGISLDSPKVPPAPSVPSYTIPSPGEEYAEMEALVPPDVESAEISDAPILSYNGEPDPSVEEITAEETVTETPAADTSVSAVSSVSDSEVASRAANKMKAFAMSQIEANNAKIAELENQSALVKNEYASRVEEANTALTLSQSSFDTVESKLSEAYKAGERAREEHTIAIAAIDDDYRRKLAALDEEYKAATFEANNKYQEFDDKNRQDIERLDGEKTAAQADLIAKRKAVAEIHTLIDTEGAKIAEQIKALKEENAGYEQFLN